MSNLDLLRAELSRRGLDGFVVPLTDEHMSEYVGGYARRLEWLTGFAGSAGTAVVLAERAALVTDGRYALQAPEQVDTAAFDVVIAPPASLSGWVAEHAPAGARIGYDPWLATRAWVRGLKGRADLVAVSANPVDAVWADRPAPSADPLRVHDAALAGRTHGEKLAEIAAAARAAGADAVVIAALDSVAWALNLRGTDVPRTPVARAFLLVRADASAVLFIDPVKLTDAVRAHLGAGVQLRPYDAFGETLRGLGGTVMADPASCVAAIFDALEAGGAKVIERRDPCALPKATKTAAEIEGARAAHRRDGRALSRYLAWFEREAPGGALDEMSAQAKLEAIRRESNELRDLSFDSISGWGPNGAVMHYRAEERTNRRIEGDGLYLIDSGGQYADGTTDVTRTVAVGAPTADMRDRFTRVLKGHIALATARFPRGTRGVQLDTLARQHLWAVDQDYAHGTGHGVGSYLSVHEGPARIASAPGANGTDEPLAPGMILSNEPGFYAAGEYGIRIENLVLVVEHAPGWLSFETLTLAPIDRRLIEVSMLSPAEIAWLDAYHARVLAAHDGLDGDDAAWLAAACAPIAPAMAAAA